MNGSIFGSTMAILMLVAVSVQAQSGPATPSPDLKKLDVWVGDWTLSGTAQDGPKSPDYKVEWRLHEHWVMGGFFLQADQIWKGNGVELHSVEFLSYDPVMRIYTGSGFSSDGTTWVWTGKFDGTILNEMVAGKGPKGEASKCRVAWKFSNDGNSVSGTQQCTQKWATWRAFNITGTKSKSGRPTATEPSQ